MAGFRGLSCTLLLLGWGSAAFGAPLVELTVGKTKYQGKSVAHNAQFCWLAARDGSYERIDLSAVDSFRKAGGEFHGLPAATLAAQLRKELGRNYEVTSRGSYVVCAPEGRAAGYCDLLNDVQKSFFRYFSRKGWKLEQEDFPLVVIVHPSKQDFDKFCALDGMSPSALMQGYYLPQSNRVRLYVADAAPAPSGNARPAKVSAQPPGDVSRSTAVHEAIHQLAFNSGLHSRVGTNPRWVVEGLATMLEAGALQSTSRDDVATRVNVERLKQFQDYRAKRRKGSLADLITDEDSLYASAPLDFYSEAWALTFYLSESRRQDYIRYLKLISDRDPLSPTYPARERLADFQSIFGSDLRRLDVQFLRFIDSLD